MLILREYSNNSISFLGCLSCKLKPSLYIKVCGHQFNYLVKVKKDMFHISVLSYIRDETGARNAFTRNLSSHEIFYNLSIAKIKPRF